MREFKESIIGALKEMDRARSPVGAIYLSERLAIPQATVGRLLFQMEAENLVKKVGSKGRILTQDGIDYLEDYERLNSRLETVNQLASLCSGQADKNRLLEVLEVRMLLEVKTAELSCENGTEAEFDRLQGCFLEWKAALRGGELGSKQDLELHLQIAKMSRNTTLYSMCKLLLTEDNVYTDFSAKAEKLSTIQSDQHREIVNGILSRHKEKAREAMYLHLKTISDDIRRSMG